jgi:hypothetical protein
MNQHLMIRTLGSNQGLEGSAEQRRCSVPVALRAPAPPQPRRSASQQSGPRGLAFA